MQRAILTLLLVTILFLPLTQPAAAGRCRVVTTDHLDGDGQLTKHLKQLCCLYQGWVYCVTIEEWPQPDVKSK